MPHLPQRLARFIQRGARARVANHAQPAARAASTDLGPRRRALAAVGGWLLAQRIEGGVQGPNSHRSVAGKGRAHALHLLHTYRDGVQVRSALAHVWRAHASVCRVWVCMYVYACACVRVRLCAGTLGLLCMCTWHVSVHMDMRVCVCPPCLSGCMRKCARCDASRCACVCVYACRALVAG